MVLPQHDLDLLLVSDVFVQHTGSAGWLTDRDTGRGRGAVRVKTQGD